MKKLLISSIVLLAATTSLASFVLAERSKTGLDIQLMTPDSPSAKYAAQELSDYAFKLTGVRMEVTTEERSQAVRIRQDDRLNENAFVLQMTPQGLEICGGKRGVLYGVYDLLERFGGVGWYASWHEVVPTLDTFEVPDDVRIAEKPAIEVREPLWYDVEGMYGSSTNAVFAARLRLNGPAANPDARMGGNGNRFGGGLGNCHTFNALVPVELFDTHPEYFSLINGKRVKDDSQRCLTNPDVLSITISNVLARIAKDPGARFYGVSQNDSYGERPNYCRCEKCAAVDKEEGTHAGTYVRFVNAVADAVKEKYPDKIIETLAYRFTREPPQKTRLRDNVMPCFCTIEDDFSTPIAKSTFCEDIATLKDLQGWAKMTSRLYIWDYTVNFMYYLRPFPNGDAMQDNIRLFRDCGATTVFEQGGCQGYHAAFAELKAWLFAKWLWNPELDKETLLNQFFKGYYGAAAPIVRAYYDELQSRQAQWSQGGKNPLTIYEGGQNTVTDPEFQVRALKMFREALEAVRYEDPVYTHNVKMSMISAAYALLKSSLHQVSLARDDDPAVRLGVNRNKLAQWILQTIDRDPYGHYVRLGECSHDSIRQELELIASGTLNGDSLNELIVPATFLTGWNSEVRDDPTAMNGKTAYMSNTHWEWSMQYPLDNIVFDKNALYTLSLHIKVAKKDGKFEDGTYAYWTGIYDGAAKKDLVMIHQKPDACSGDWQWVDINTWKPQVGQYLWIGPGQFDKGKHKANPCHDGVYVDAIRIRRGK